MAQRESLYKMLGMTGYMVEEMVAIVGVGAERGEEVGVEEVGVMVEEGVVMVGQEATKGVAEEIVATIVENMKNMLENLYLLIVEAVGIWGRRRRLWKLQWRPCLWRRC